MPPDDATWQPYREPSRVTLVRTITIALAVGLVLALAFGGVSRWPAAALLALWPALGGHYVELVFLNGIRQRLPASRTAQVAARLAVWFVGGMLLALGVVLTAMALPGFRAPSRPALWIFAGGPAFIAIELIAHLVLQVRGLPSFYNGRG